MPKVSMGYAKKRENIHAKERERKKKKKWKKMHAKEHEEKREKRKERNKIAHTFK